MASTSKKFVLQAFVTQVYKRCKGGRVSKTTVLREMEDERLGLGLTVTDYVDLFCRWAVMQAKPHFH